MTFCQKKTISTSRAQNTIFTKNQKLKLFFSCSWGKTNWKKQVFIIMQENFSYDFDCRKKLPLIWSYFEQRLVANNNATSSFSSLKYFFKQNFVFKWIFFKFRLNKTIDLNKNSLKKKNCWKNILVALLFVSNPWLWAVAQCRKWEF